VGQLAHGAGQLQPHSLIAPRMSETELKGLIDHCTNRIGLPEVQPLIDFLSRMQNGQISQAEQELLRQLLKLEAPLPLPESERGRQFLLRGVIESARGSQAATETGTRPKRELMEGIFAKMQEAGILTDWRDSSREARYDYRLAIEGRTIYVEAKGGFDGNSTRISEFPADAAETWKWFMVEGSPRNDPSTQVKKNRLLGDMVSKQKAETGFMVLDYLCGDPEVRPCPKPAHARLNVLPDLPSPFPDLFLLPSPPWPAGEMTWATWQPAQQQWVSALQQLWQLPDGHLRYHIHLIGIELADDEAQFRWGMRALADKVPWYLSQFRRVRR
jgi:hypothetical protein